MPAAVGVGGQCLGDTGDVEDVGRVAAGTAHGQGAARAGEQPPAGDEHGDAGRVQQSHGAEVDNDGAYARFDELAEPATDGRDGGEVDFAGQVEHHGRAFDVLGDAKRLRWHGTSRADGEAAEG